MMAETLKITGTQTREVNVISRRATLMTSLGLVGLAVIDWPVWARGRRGGPLHGLDTDNDGTVDLNEAKRAASALFDKLDRDHDGTLSRRELRGRVSASDFSNADPDRDGTLSKDEYLALVERRFRAADTDNDGTLTAKELNSPAGRALLRLLK
jgi:EF hand